MPGAHAGDHAAGVAEAGQRLEQRQRVAHRGGDQRDRRGRAGMRRQHGQARHARMDAHAPFRHHAERPDQRRGEGGGQRGVRLLHEAGGVDVVVQHGQRAEAACGGGRGHARRGQQVGGAVGAGRVGAAHRAGHHHRPVAGHQRVEQEGAFLDGVGALDDHGAVHALREGGLDAARDVDQDVGRERGAGQAGGALGLDARHLREVRHARHQFGGAELGRDAALRLRQHGDGAAQREDQQARQAHRPCPSGGLSPSGISPGR